MNGKQIQVFQNNSDIPLNLFVFINQDIINRADLILNEEYKKNYYYQIGIGVISEEIFQGNLSTYFDIPPNSLANFNLLLDKLTISCGNTLTVAECFARAMGFIAECIDSELERIYGYMPFRSFLHFNVFILTAYEIFFDEENKEEFLNKLTFLLDRFTKNDIDFKQKLNNINIKYQSNPQKYDWLKTHGDHNFSDTTEGWKNFGLDNDGGHKHHFIANAMVYNFYTILVPFINIMENHSFFGIEDVEIDRMYNEKGREFASWGTSYVGNILLQYRPNAVYNKIKELIVENETIQ